MSEDITDTSSQSDPKSTEAAKEGLREQQIQVPFPESYVYSNVSALSITFMDLRISFAEAGPDGTAQAKMGVVMPPEAAAQLVMNILAQLNFFEDNFGPIRHPRWKQFQANAKANMAMMKALQPKGASSAKPAPSVGDKPKE